MTAPNDFITRLEGRGFVHVSGADAETLLDNTISNSLAKHQRTGEIIHAGLLTPQGKILFAFFVVRLEDGFLLDTNGESAAGLIQRLAMYRLRADVKLTDVSDAWSVVVASDAALLPDAPKLVASGIDPRGAAAGLRAYFDAPGAINVDDAATATYHEHRISAGLADAVTDFALGDTFTHEANWDETGSVDFSKGCFIGQEVVSRTRHKTVVRKRICRISSTASIPAGSDITAGDTSIGQVLSVAPSGKEALAMVRIDRAAKATTAGQKLSANGLDITVDPDRIAAFVAASAQHGDQTVPAS